MGTTLPALTTTPWFDQTPTMLLLLPLILVSSLASADQLPANMLGKYQLETSEGFSDFMSEIGVNWFTRQIACALYPTATNKNLGGNKVGIDTSSTFKSTSIAFEFGVPFVETTGDGTEVRTTATLNGNSLIKDQKALKPSGVSRIETRNFRQNGQIMELVHTIPGKAKIRSVRVYKKV